ncbi:DUF3565 domain-containing protein [Alphaproteobacteria bacterium]|nr:DUF3565 domain-containing protein [Alphaproteobacteria bacterium]
MKAKITGFHQDEYKDWVADSSCGHSRHNPPFTLSQSGLHLLKVEIPT